MNLENYTLDKNGLYTNEVVTGEEFTKHSVEGKLKERNENVTLLITQAAQTLGYTFNSSKDFFDFCKEFIIVKWQTKGDEFSPHGFLYVDKQRKFQSLHSTLPHINPPLIKLFLIYYEFSSKFDTDKQAVEKYLTNPEIIPQDQI